jgi:hypothetical protein
MELDQYTAASVTQREGHHAGSRCVSGIHRITQKHDFFIFSVPTKKYIRIQITCFPNSRLSIISHIFLHIIKNSKKLIARNNIKKFTCTVSKMHQKGWLIIRYHLLFRLPEEIPQLGPAFRESESSEVRSMVELLLPSLQRNGFPRPWCPILSRHPGSSRRCALFIAPNDPYGLSFLSVVPPKVSIICCCRPFSVSTAAKI